jgi:catechol 2,3-dioxygenase-like lactoylglutathione lyase family enzyme
VIGSLQCVVLDCPDAPALAVFYRQLLGGVVNEPDRRWATGPDFATLHTPGGPVLAFQRVRGFVAPRWPDAAHPQQLHIDVDVPDADAAHERVLTIGASLLTRDPRGWIDYADPAGHPFCLIPGRSQA